MSLIRNFHDARLSLILSAIKHVLGHGGEARAGLAAEHPNVEAAGRLLEGLDEGKSLDSIAGTADDCVKLVVAYAWAIVTGNEKRQQQIADQYKDSSCDPGWLIAVGAYIEYYWLENRQPAYRDVASGSRLVYDLQCSGSDDALVVGLLGDWGTGEPVAQVTANQLFGLHQPDVVLHVGDIYYAGTHEETQHNFLLPIIKARALCPQKTVPVYTIPGNHDYYSGGEAFYSLLAQINASEPQGASFFSLQNDWLQLQAMDTGYYDHILFKVADDITHLHDSEAEWHCQQIEAGVKAGRKILLFSHHQLFSALLNIGKSNEGKPDSPNYNPNLMKQLGAQLPEVTAWYWGHEHLLEVYKPYSDFDPNMPGIGLDKGRCIGHSAFPVLTGSNAYEVKFSKVPLDTSVELGKAEEVYDHGYVVLNLAPHAGSASYYSVPGDAVCEPGNPNVSTQIYSEVLWGAPGL